MAYPKPEKADDQQAPRRISGKFAPGTSGNPAGRREGSRNNATLALQQILLADGEAVLRRAVELALAGNESAMKLVIERLLPVAKERAISLPLPNLEKCSDVADAIRCAVVAVSEGELTPSEASVVLNLLAELRSALLSKSSDLQSEAFDSLMKLGK